MTVDGYAFSRLDTSAFFSPAKGRTVIIQNAFINHDLSLIFVKSVSSMPGIGC